MGLEKPPLDSYQGVQTPSTIMGDRRVSTHHDFLDLNFVDCCIGVGFGYVLMGHGGHGGNGRLM